MEWQLLVGGFAAPVVTTKIANNITMEVMAKRGGVDLNGATFRCSAVDSGGNTCTNDIIVSVKGMCILEMC